MAVIAGKGVVGRVINQPAPHAAQVQLLIGRNAAAAVTLERTGAGGAACVGGASDLLLTVDYVSNSGGRPGRRARADVGAGRHLSGRFLVGTVERSETGTNYRTVTVRPAVDFSHLDVVLVVLAKPATDASLLTPGRACRPRPRPRRSQGAAVKLTSVLVDRRSWPSSCR